MFYISNNGKGANKQHVIIAFTVLSNWVGHLEEEFENTKGVNRMLAQRYQNMTIFQIGLQTLIKRVGQAKYLSI